ncbi:TetR/AcrR family transcriptional regulator [Subtercola boreus]|nr:TetR/AcrR family transcriptional regulator [Subtercola boreus]
MADIGTKGQILLHAARLFGQRGYHGTSTRDIAESVGIRQPSLFYHFGSKHLILSELIDADLAQDAERFDEAMALDVGHAERFHFFLAVTSRDYLTLPYDARGYYGDAVFSEPEFAPQRQAIEQQHANIRHLVERGIEAHEFQAIDVDFVQGAVNGLQFEGMRKREINRDAPVSKWPLQVADFILRAILVDPSTLADVRRTAAELLGEQSER